MLMTRDGRRCSAASRIVSDRHLAKMLTMAETPLLLLTRCTPAPTGLSHPPRAPSNPALAKPRDRADSEKENRPDHVSCFYPNTCGVILCFELVICAKKDFNLFYYHVCLVNINMQRSELDNSNNSTKRKKKELRRRT